MTTYPTNVPAAVSPVVGSNGLVTQAWLAFFTALWNRTGGAPGGGNTNITTASIATGLPLYANDAAAKTGGVPQWGFYLNDSGLQVRRLP